MNVLHERELVLRHKASDVPHAVGRALPLDLLAHGALPMAVALLPGQVVLVEAHHQGKGLSQDVDEGARMLRHQMFVCDGDRTAIGPAPSRKWNAILSFPTRDVDIGPFD